MSKEAVIQKLKEVLGSVFGLYFNTHAAHWNVEGLQFRELHAMFEEQYRDLWASVDDIAEQIRQLDAYAPQSLSRIVALNSIEPISNPSYDIKVVLGELKDGHEKVIALLTEANELAVSENLQGLSNYLCGRLEVHAKHRWFLRASAK